MARPPHARSPVALHEDRRQTELRRVREMRAPWLWTNVTVMALGVWLVSAPFTFGYSALRMTVSDGVSGVLLIALSALAVSPAGDFWGRWGVALVGVWLEFAPLLFWAPSPVAYTTDTLIGALAIALSILVPMMPGLAHHREMNKPGPEVPPGWTFNPSSWHQRAPLIALALAGWFISRYLAAFELGYIHGVWDPFFGNGTVQVLTSKVSRSFPVSDAGLGAFAYTFEFLMGWMGGITRWRSMPWMACFFFVLVVPLGLVHITLVILQPVVVGHWCTLCLAAASVMLMMIPMAVDEVIAALQFVKLRVKRGDSFWRVFWVGGTVEENEEKDERTPAYGDRVARHIGPLFRAVSVPWGLIGTAAVGVFLMFCPVLFGDLDRGALANSAHLIGALITTLSVISLGEPVRALRFLNVALGLWILASGFIFGAPRSERWSLAAAGIAVVLLVLPRGPVRERYGSWNRLIV